MTAGLLERAWRKACDREDGAARTLAYSVAVLHGSDGRTPPVLITDYLRAVARREHLGRAMISRSEALKNRIKRANRLIVIKMMHPTAYHEALKQDLARWHDLKFIGIQHAEADDEGPASAMELRNCTCGSTLAKVIP